MKLALTSGGTNITKRIISIKKVAQFEDGKILGNCPSSEYQVELHNEDGYFNDTNIDQEYRVYLYDNQHGDNTELDYELDTEESNDETIYIDDTEQEDIDNEEIIVLNNLFDTLYCYEKPQDYSSSKLSLTLYDNMARLNVPHSTDIMAYPRTIESIIAEIGNLTNTLIRLNTEKEITDTVTNLVVNSYDTNLTCRQVLGYICELLGAYAAADVDGTININNFGNDLFVESDDYVYELEFSSELDYETVAYDNGLVRDVAYRKINGQLQVEEPKETETIYLSSDNLYYGDYDNVDRQALLQNIADVVLGKGFFKGINPIKKFSGRYITDMKLGSFLNYETYFSALVTHYEISFYNGELAHSIMDVSSTLNNEKVEESVHSVEQSNISNRLKIRIDEVDNQLELLRTSGSGNNLIKDSIGVFYSIFDENARVWKYNGTLEDVVLYATNSSVASINPYGYALSVPYGSVTQSIVLPIGTYTLSFAYTSPIGEESYDIYGNVMLDGELVTTFGMQQANEFQEIETSFDVIGQARTMELSFYNGMVNGQVLVANLMLNTGVVKKDWSLANDETFDEYVKIGRGIEIGDATSEVKFKAMSNIIGFTRGDEFVSTFNEDGMETNGVKVKENANLLGLGVSRMNNQVVFYIDETWGV